jgi:putative phosphoesterase
MRILVLSDIHGNRQALEAIREEFDVCLFLGDLVDYCLEPGPCIEWDLQGANGFRYLSGVTRPHSIAKLDEADRKYLAGLPTALHFTLDNKRFFLVHGTPRDPLDEFAPADIEFWKRRLDHIDADYVCVGHTHTQFVLQAGKTTVLNPGSVGLPRDGDPRAAYAVITENGPELKRVEYPIEETIATIVGADLPDPAKELLAEILRTGKIERKNGSSDSALANGQVRKQIPL